MTTRAANAPGPIALVGSGEYLPQMQPIDTLLLQQVGGRSARVVVLPTAAGLEAPTSHQRWARMGLEHFAGLGARVDAVDILMREDAFDQRWLPLLEAADFVYFSGGSPQHLIQTLHGSPAWEAIRGRHAGGAVLAGCSAGAMAFGGWMLQPRRLWRASPSDSPGPAPDADSWHPALGLVPRITVLPHFDRMAARIGQHMLAQLATSLPAGVTLVGIDEDTALVCLEPSPASAGVSAWQVMGRQMVSVCDAEHGWVQHAAGASLMLDVS